MTEEEDALTTLFLATISSDKNYHERCFQEAKLQMSFSEEDYEQCQDGIWNLDQARKFTLSDNLKDFFEDEIDDVSDHYKEKDKGCLIATLVRSAFNYVNWHEVADYYLGIAKQ